MHVSIKTPSTVITLGFHTQKRKKERGEHPWHVPCWKQGYSPPSFSLSYMVHPQLTLNTCVAGFCGCVLLSASHLFSRNTQTEKKGFETPCFPVWVFLWHHTILAWCPRARHINWCERPCAFIQLHRGCPRVQSYMIGLYDYVIKNVFLSEGEMPISPSLQLRLHKISRYSI